MLHLVASRTGGSGASVAKMLLASGAKDFRLARDTVRDRDLAVEEQKKLPFNYLHFFK